MYQYRTNYIPSLKSYEICIIKESLPYHQPKGGRGYDIHGEFSVPVLVKRTKTMVVLRDDDYADSSDRICVYYRTVGAAKRAAAATLNGKRVLSDKEAAHHHAKVEKMCEKQDRLVRLRRLQREQTQIRKEIASLREKIKADK